MKLIPFGEVMKDRIEISKRYGLIEMTAHIWRLTEKCKNNYDSMSYLLYLRGEIEKPKRLNKKLKTAPKQKITPNRQQAIDSVISL